MSGGQRASSSALDDAVEVLRSGTVAILPEGLLRARLAEGRPLRVKLGIDPSGTDLTLGHAVVLRKLRQFQDLGHLAVLIIGDFTGTVGDPTGTSTQRQSLSREQTETNAATYVEQVLRVLDPDRVEVRRNSDWLAELSMADVVREARELTVARLLERDDFAKRHARGQSISLVEFLYPLLQGYDSVAVRADVELGGSDQTYNLLVGRDLQRAHGHPPQVVLTVPLLVGLDGSAKMSKSLGNYVAIDEPPEEQFGKLMSLPDDCVGDYLRLCTAVPPAQLAALESQVREGGPAAAAAKRRLAREVVALYHSPAAAQAAQAAFDARFRHHAAPAVLPEHTLGAEDLVHLPALLVQVGFAPSRAAARRSVAGGGVRLDGVVLTTDDLDLDRARVLGRVLALGRRRQVRLVAEPG